MTCPICEGRGWRWVGQVDNAVREMCDFCLGKGRGGFNWLLIAMVTFTLAGWGVTFGFIYWALTIIVN